MHGNVWEWCSDYYDVYTTTAQTNPDGPSTGMHRVFRGGCWHRSAQFCRSTAREFTPPIILLNLMRILISIMLSWTVLFSLIAQNKYYLEPLKNAISIELELLMK